MNVCPRSDTVKEEWIAERGVVGVAAFIKQLLTDWRTISMIVLGAVMAVWYCI
ncbi:hypothetical protein GCM10025858_04750 [Alicyclobacillus sacchari]|nr:hypothetical protein GCM10025858_04750 [Alicyclobacillus sacchari]